MEIMEIPISPFEKQYCEKCDNALRYTGTVEYVWDDVQYVYSCDVCKSTMFTSIREADK